MRVVGGTLSGRRLEAPAGASTRPTSDKVREAIFNRLVHRAIDVDVDPLAGPVLDLYAGSGALGLEAISRGAPRADLVESARAACSAIRANIEALALSDVAKLHALRVEAFLRRPPRERYQLVFADPPYAEAGRPLTLVLDALVAGAWLADEALIVVEHAPSPAPEAADTHGLVFLDRRAYGQTVVSFFARRGRGISEDA